MADKFIVGNIFHSQKKTYVPAIGYPLEDGCYQFFVIGSNDHFRKTPDNNDYIDQIKYEVFDAISKATRTLS